MAAAGHHILTTVCSAALRWNGSVAMVNGVLAGMARHLDIAARIASLNIGTCLGASHYSAGRVAALDIVGDIALRVSRRWARAAASRDVCLDSPLHPAHRRTIRLFA